MLSPLPCVRFHQDVRNAAARLRCVPVTLATGGRLREPTACGFLPGPPTEDAVPYLSDAHAPARPLLVQSRQAELVVRRREERGNSIPVYLGCVCLRICFIRYITHINMGGLCAYSWDCQSLVMKCQRVTA